jgi:hypothetical protein
MIFRKGTAPAQCPDELVGVLLAARQRPDLRVATVRR